MTAAKRFPASAIHSASSTPRLPAASAIDVARQADLTDYARPVGTVRQFAGYWVNLTPAPPGRALPPRPFAPAAAYTSAGWWGGMGDLNRERVDLACLDKCGDGISPLHAAPFLQPLLPRALAARRSFQVGHMNYDDRGDPVTATAIGRSMWESGYAYAAAHPSDPRSPEALYRLIRVARWGANPGGLGRRAFLLLHLRYPRSIWTQRSPYYYRLGHEPLAVLRLLQWDR